MYTSCPDCGTVFRIAPEDLRRAGGQVRCGSCGGAFNALASLSASAPEPLPEPAAPGAVELPEPATDTSSEDPLEFNVPADRWTSFFSATEAPPIPSPPARPTSVEEPQSARSGEAAANATEEAGAESDAALAEPGLDDELSPEDWDELLADLPEPVYVIDSTETAQDDAAAAYPAEQLATTIEMPPARERLYPAPASRERAPAPAPEPPADTDPADADDEFPAYTGPTARPRRRRWPWALGSLMLALILLMQWVHMERDRLAAHPAFGEMVRTSYGQLGQTLYPAWDLQAYDISGLEAIAGGSQADVLDIAARLEFRGNTPAGLPLLRVTITDRWSNVVGQRLISPAEYAQQRAATLIAPGAIVPVQVSVRDPGIDAHGFEMDICLQQRRAGLVCQQKETPFR